jgi:predicted RNase H-like HicB family nuclease
MVTYPLYLESGPRMRTTMVHVPALLGCIARGATTTEALQNTPAAVTTYLVWLASHGETVDPLAPFELSIASHVTEGPWIGYGDPASGFVPDFEPLSSSDHQCYLIRLAFLQSDLLAFARDLSTLQLAAEPSDGHRSIYNILFHAAESQVTYLRYLTGPVAGLTAALKSLTPADDLPANLAAVFGLIHSRLSALTPEERTKLIPHGQVTWSARRCFRRSLEHSWEHLLEIRARLLLEH